MRAAPILSVFLLLGTFCSMPALNNPADPLGRSYYELQILRCLLTGMGCGPSAIPAPPATPLCTSCRIYVTTTGYMAVTNFITAAGADVLCNADAAKPNTSNYKAILVDGLTRNASTTANLGDGQIDWALFANTAYYRADGITPVMTTNANRIFVFGSMTNSFDTIASLYWTGMTPNWTVDGAGYCAGWTLTGPAGSRGNGSFLDGNALSNVASACNIAQSLLCAEQ